MHYLICIINNKLFLLRALHIPFNASYVVYIITMIISSDLIRSQLKLLEVTLLFVSCHCLKYSANVLFHHGTLHSPGPFWLCNKANYYTSNSPSLFGLAESVQWNFEICTCDVIKLQITIMSRPHKVTDNHVRAICVTCCQWRSENMTSSFFFQCMIKQLLEAVFVISIITKILVRGITVRQPWSFWISQNLIQ